MPVQLPDHFVVPDLIEVEIRNHPKVICTRYLATEVILSPLDLGPGFHMRTKQRKLMRHDLFSKPFHLSREGGSAERFGGDNAVG